MDIYREIAEFIASCEKFGCKPYDKYGSAGARTIDGLFKIWNNSTDENGKTGCLQWDYICPKIAEEYCRLRNRIEMTSDAEQLMEIANHIWKAWNHQARMNTRPALPRI